MCLCTVDVETKQYTEGYKVFKITERGIMGEIGYGISSQIHDNNNEIVKVITRKQKVSIGDEEWNFNEFIKEV